MIDSLVRLGIAVNVDPADRSFDVFGCGGRIRTDVSLFVANSGTTVRFLTALVALGKARFGSTAPRMRQRPIRICSTAMSSWALRQGAETAGCPPVWLKRRACRAAGADARRCVESVLERAVAGRPYARAAGMDRRALVSQPYVRMTLSVMRAFGVDVETMATDCFRVPAPVPIAAGLRDRARCVGGQLLLCGRAIAGGQVTVEVCRPTACKATGFLRLPGTHGLRS